MTKRAGDMAFENIRFQLCVFSAAHDVDEVLKMTGGARELPGLLPIQVINGCRVIIGNDDVAAFTIDYYPDAAPVVIVHFIVAGAAGQAADFEDERRNGIAVEDDLSIGCGAVVDVTKSSTD